MRGVEGDCSRGAKVLKREFERVGDQLLELGRHEDYEVNEPPQKAADGHLQCHARTRWRVFRVTQVLHCYASHGVPETRGYY